MSKVRVKVDLENAVDREYLMDMGFRYDMVYLAEVLDFGIYRINGFDFDKSELIILEG
ncbi:hypothetical protein [Clostridium perfringens]|uniref:hypothetical protein n=1 Tax=Clostridium perfringens TaxID=1502 RepID=UPI00374A6DB7